jgi:hypothetical protein
VTGDNNLRVQRRYNRSSAAIQFFRLSGVVSSTYMRHWFR